MLSCISLQVVNLIITVNHNIPTFFLRKDDYLLIIMNDLLEYDDQ